LGRRIRCTPPLKNAYHVGYPTATADSAHYANADPEQQPAFVGRFTQPLLAADTQTALVAFAGTNFPFLRNRLPVRGGPRKIPGLSDR